jgi:glycosyltransferase involved in cell wall biosynthesis
MGVNPKITVIMSVFNGERYLEESINSILGQSYKNFEFIIADDASHDKTPRILKHWATKDPRIKIITNTKNIGLTVSLNKAIRRARGEYLARQDFDDISLNQRFEKQIEFLKEHPEVMILGTFGFVTNSDGKILREMTLPTSFAEIKKELIKRNPFIHTSVMMKKDFINEIGGYNEKFRISQDYELWFRSLRKGRAENLPLFLVKKRCHPQMISLTSDMEYLRNAIFLRKQAIEKGDYSKLYYIYLLKPYLSFLSTLFFKKLLKRMS